MKPAAGKTYIKFYKIPLCLLFCRRPHEVCTFISGNFRSECSQVYNYHRLLTWDDVKGLHMDIFKVRCTELSTKTIRTKGLHFIRVTAAAVSSRNKLSLYLSTVAIKGVWISWGGAPSIHNFGTIFSPRKDVRRMRMREQGICFCFLSSVVFTFSDYQLAHSLRLEKVSIWLSQPILIWQECLEDWKEM